MVMQKKEKGGQQVKLALSRSKYSINKLMPKLMASGGFSSLMGIIHTILMHFSDMHKRTRL